MTLALTTFALAAIGTAGAWIRSRRRHPTALRPLHNAIFLAADQMARVARWECARTDRSEVPFSVAVFPIGETTDTETAERLESTLRNRARVTDIVGWLNEDSLCALLVESTVAGAQAFAEKLVSEAAGQGRLPAPVVYHYSGAWRTGSADDASAKTSARTSAQPEFALSA